MSIDSTGKLTWTPEEGLLFSGVINLYVWDTTEPIFGIDRPDIQTFTIDVIPINDPPEIISIAPSTATEGKFKLIVFVVINAPNYVLLN